jgi:Domain of unknown function (DUF6916)
MIGSRFEIASDEWRGVVQLTDVIPGPRSANVEQFSAVFVSGDRTAPARGTYEVRHPDAGRFQLHLDGTAASKSRVAAFALLRD